MTGGEKLFAAVLLLGFVLLTGAFAWPHLHNPRQDWSREQAQERTKRGIELHYREHELMEAKTEEEREVLIETNRAAIEEYKQSDAGLQEVLKRQHRAVLWLRWSGTACLLVGAVGILILRKQRS
ncbi:MAG: hypothetical protein JW818_16765 [Pirellulales bacterium]|nr:hypothetical protein [Pirellulales bacterium]